MPWHGLFDFKKILTMINFPSTNTKASDFLCKEIAKKSKGVCFLGFSRGKDSLCSWLQLRRYFKTIIPFHCGDIPHLEYAEQALKYYEYEFDCHILRMQAPTYHADMYNMCYQLPWDEEFYDGWGINPKDSLSEVVEYLRYIYALPNAWCAFGINASDSLQRRIQVMQRGGVSKKSKHFYPCFDWSHEQIIKTVEECGLKVAPDYQMSNRTIAGIPNVRWLEQMRKNYPNDFRKILKRYPLCWASVIRQEYRKELRDKLEEAENAAK